MNIIYLRVSTKNKGQDTEQQLKAILGKYKLTSYKLMKDIGSAYKKDLMAKRIDFLELLDICFNASKTTIKDLFLSNYDKKDIDLYVWDYSRIVRDIEFNMIFNILADWYNVNIYSYNDRAIIKKTDNETPTTRMARHMMNTFVGYSSEDYSYKISVNTKKAFTNGYSFKGSKWGKGYHRIDGSKVKLSIEEEKEFKKGIKKLLRQYNRSEVIEMIAKEYDIAITHSWISRNFRGIN